MQNGTLSFDAYIQDTNFSAQLARMERGIVGLTRTAQTETSKLDSTFQRLGQLAAGYFSFTALAALPGQIVKARGEMQQLEIAFTTMLRSKEKADALLAQIKDFALATPFDVKDVATGGKQLLAYGFQANEVVTTLKTLGEVSAGVGTPLSHIIYLYGTLRSQGRAFSKDITQFTGQGIPLADELARQLGIVEKNGKSASGQVMDMVEAGKIGFAEVQKAFQGMTTGSGLFAGGMEAQSKSILGLIARLKESWGLMLNDIGRQNEGALNATLAFAADAIGHYQQVLDVLKILVVTYGAYRTAIIATTVAQQIATATSAGWTLSQLAGYRALLLAEGAQKLLNATMLANPYVLAATAIVGLISAVVVYRNELTAAEQAEAKIGEARSKATDAATNELAKIQALTSQINNESLSREFRAQKLKELIAISPAHLNALTLDSVKTGEAKTAIDAYVEALKRKIELQEISSQLEASAKRELDAQRGKNEVSILGKAGVALRNTFTPGNLETDLSAEQRKVNQQAIADEKKVQAELNKRIEALNKTGKASANAGNEAKKSSVKTVQGYTDEIEALKKRQQEESTSQAQYQQFQKQIDSLEKQRNRLTGEQTKEQKDAAKKAQKDADKTGPYGSIAYWDYVAQKADEIIQKAPNLDDAGIQIQIARKREAEEKAEELRKKLAKQSFDDELAEKRKLYQQYAKFAQNVDETAANQQYASLLANGKTYVDYLNAQITKLEAKRNESGKLNEKDALNLTTLYTERDDATGAKSKIDLFAEGLARSREQAQNLTEWLEILKDRQDQLQGDNTDFGFAARQQVAEEMVQAEGERRAQLRQFLQEVAGSEQQRTAIAKRYTDLRAALDKSYTNKKSEGYKKAIAQIGNAEKEELEALDRKVAESGKAFKNLNKVIDATGREALKIRLNRLKEYLAELEKTVGKEAEIYKETLKAYKDGGRELNANSVEMAQQLAGIVGELGSAFSEFGGFMGQYGGFLSGISGSVGNISTAFRQDATDIDKVSSGINGLIGLINVVGGAARQRKQAEEDYYRSVIQYQQEYNKALNDQIGLQAEQGESVFLKDFEGRLKNGLSKMADAETKYQASLKKLNEGRAKSGQKNAVDMAAIGKAAGSGAAIGATIGSVVPVIGTAIGAVGGAIVGGIVGLFGGKKKADEFMGLLAAYPGLIKKGADGWEELDADMAKALISQNRVDEATKQMLQSAIEWQEQIKEAKKQVEGVISELAGQLGSDLRGALVSAFKDGTSAAEAFGASVSKILEDLLSQLIFNRVFSEQFKKLEEEMIASYDGGDGNWIDDFGRFFAQAGDLSKQFYDGLEAAQNAAAQYGLSVFDKNDPKKATNQTSLQGAIKGVSEETASVLAGQINAMRINGAEVLAVTRSQLMQLTEINANTKNLSYLKEIKDLLERDPLRSKGNPG